MNPEDLRAFARRRWDLIEDSKRTFLADQYRADPAAHFASMSALYAHMRQVRPEWPRPEDLAADLSELIEWKAKIDRASRNLRVR